MLAPSTRLRLSLWLRRSPQIQQRCFGTSMGSSQSSSLSSSTTLSTFSSTRRVPIMQSLPLEGRGIFGTTSAAVAPYSSTTMPSKDPSNRVADTLVSSSSEEELPPGSRAFVECEREALIDLFHRYASDCDTMGRYLDRDGLASILRAVGETTDEETLEKLFQTADINGDGTIELDEFLTTADVILGGAPAGIILVVGGPGSGKGLLSKRLEKECGVVHLSSGDLLRDEVRRDTILGRQVRDIMAKGELVSSAVIVTLIRRVMRNHPGKLVLLDGFPRSLQNAHDLVELCGTPLLALHLECDDTVLMERILKRAENEKEGGRDDDNIHTALTRLRTFHQYHHSTMEWLREHHVPVVNLDCSGPAENVWNQLSAIGRLMRPVTRIPAVSSSKPNDGDQSDVA